MRSVLARRCGTIPMVRAYADMRGEDGVRRTMRVRTRAFRTWLSGVFYGAEGAAMAGRPRRTRLTCFAAKAIYDGVERDVYVRIARGPHGETYLDLGDDSWAAVRVTSSGWDIVSDAPVRFQRPHGLRPLPRPARGGQLRGLRSLLNVTADRDWILVVAWLVGTLRPERPVPGARPDRRGWFGQDHTWQGAAPSRGSEHRAAPRPAS